ncbi:MAG: tRNA (adenosine(37)-N6)-dimethylallyltransferase MiaA [Deltaproteobacteria bacterium]|nr:tRNA (adenosine(37)-N6)-dimethylallyltransferase MiaA [Deltaproteobacteria bacterium]NCP02082.1 tRNA (adenosine(37)-N6)-dimethylallyltransferase MiaA [Deltaproteobacteria bacterium]NCP78528.1 tRNA (adenosine(37)-N6)-dimethylallyltransferase MiaA [Desulfuromonadales bacterium]
MGQIPLLIIQGPTASGKTAWAIRLAQKFPLEVISADSRQIYRQMTIGTAKPSPAERAAVPHHLLDLIAPDQNYSVAAYVEQAREIARDIFNRGKLPCVVGGTGLYIRALVGGLADVPQGDLDLRNQLKLREEHGGAGTLYRDLAQIDAVAAATIHPHNLVKIIRALEVFHLSGQPISLLQQQHGFSDHFFRPVFLAPAWPKDLLHQRIAQRSAQMLEQGLIDETRCLVAQYGQHLKALQTLGYRETLAYLRNELSLTELDAEIQRQTRRYAKRQMTWFRKEKQTIWVDSCQESGRICELIRTLITW